MHERSNFCYLICLRHLCSHYSSQIFFTYKDTFSFTRAHHRVLPSNNSTMIYLCRSSCSAKAPCHLYKMVAQNMLRTHEEKKISKLFGFEDSVDVAKCL